VIDTLLYNVRASGLKFTVYLGVNDNHIADQLREENVHCIQCGRADEGMGGTLAEASGHIPGWDGVMVALAGMPWIAPDTYLKVAAQLSSKRICVPSREGHRGHPVGFGR
jgi:molybdenum cofactor cytidylyltransferase